MGIQAADNRVASVIALYRDQLAPLYEESEARAITRAVFHERLGWDAAQMELRKFQSLHESDLLKVYLPLKRLRAGEPLQYVLGKVDFHGLAIAVTPDVLIPRPETEELVELVFRSGSIPTRIVDVGTGSGCIALALKKCFPGAQVFAMDVSRAALQVAEANGRSLGLEVTWMEADALAADFDLPDDLDLVVSNPPYIPVEEAEALHARVRAREPYLALFAPEGDPLAFYHRIGECAWRRLRKQGTIWFECHFHLAHQAADLLRAIGFQEVMVMRDLSGNDRFIRAKR